MVTITASYTVIPNEPTPHGRLWLSDIDQVVRMRHTPTIYIYKPYQNPENAIETLKTSLSKILVQYYPMAGRLCYTEGARLELNLNAKGAILLEAQTSKTIHDYGDFSPSDSTKELVPVMDYNQPIEDIPLFVVQLTRFQNNEGFAIGVAFFHPLSDGLGAIRFINSWAKIARGETLEANELRPFLDRTLLKFSHTPLAPCFEHMELKPLPLILGREDTSEERKKKTSATLLRLSPEQVDKLKIKANENDILAMKKKGSRAFSRYEAIGAHLWRCASKARELEENQESVVRFNADVRTRMIPNLPKNYFGNALTQTAAKGYVGEITSKPLGYVSQMIREASEIVTDEFIRSQIDVIRGFEHLDDARALFLGEGENIPYFGNPNFHLTSWMSMPVYEADFGWGKPVYFGIAYVSPHDRAVILLSPDGDGSILVCLHFQNAHLELFKKFFYGDI
ncbi:hydroxycinnamoyl-CoA:piscidic acid hydroxycinnamoyltransferase-like [Vicia villosa]|uniref:hydroxycinnamoyl-CoA:piscidic acid hydroxycinnamoyltransferase-like n=1 Tax=Vicia villosa TaxID=3911 RepID=UPI00273AD177|nr:hydroxycinnamoyl-CoA:piscidic acid hydroxycinnamoyltransferase-like [Vicia villosa]